MRMGAGGNRLFGSEKTGGLKAPRFHHVIGGPCFSSFTQLIKQKEDLLYRFAAIKSFSLSTPTSFSCSRVYGEDEWSFGFCEQGTGVFSCPSGKNPMYTYREKIVLGETNFSIFKVNQILRELSREWPGSSYDLLSKNCNHFCDEFCEKLGVPKLPGWVNRFANAGDAAMEVAGNTAIRLRQAKTEIASASKVAYRFLLGVTTNNGSAPESPGNSNRGSPRFQTTWFRNLVPSGAKPTSSTDIDNQDDGVLLWQHRRKGSDQSRGQNSTPDSETISATGLGA